MARKPSGRPNGRTPIHIEQKEFELLCKINATIFEVCSAFGCEETTVNRWCKEKYGESFAGVLARLAGQGRTSLRRKVWQKALDDSNQDQWKALDKLCDKHLGMGRQPEQSLTVHQTPDKELKVNWVSKTADKTYTDE